VIVSINQPAYLPWLGYFHRVLRSDLHVVLDHVQFEKNSFTNRNRVRTPQDWTWLSVPVRTKGRFGELRLHELEIVNERPWARKHFDTLRFNYRRAGHFAAEADYWGEVYAREWTRLADLQRETTGHTLGALGIDVPLRSSSELDVGGAKDELVLNLCRAVGASVYLSGPLGRDYLVPERFADAGIELRYHDYVPPTYPQAHPGFEPGLAALDAVLCLGAPATRDLLEATP